MPRLPGAEDLGTRPTPQPAQGMAGYAVPGGAEMPGEAMIGLGRTVAGIGADFEHEQDKIDTTRVEDAWNQYKNAAMDLTIGDKGLLKTQGADAVNGNLLQTATKTLADTQKGILDGLATDQQRQRFAQRAAITDLQVKQQVLSHIDTQEQNYAQTTIQGSEAAARAQIMAVPTNPDVFKGARDTLMRQADAYLDLRGIKDPGARDGYKDKMNDALWSTRIDSLLYDKPLLAEALFRANSAEIKNPELRLLLQHKTTEAAVTVNAGLTSSQEIDQGISGLMQKKQTPAPVVGGTFDTVVNSLLGREGGYVAKDGASGAPANFGINQRANPDIDVSKLTRQGAIDIYKKRYWDAIGGDNLQPAAALVALDAAALQGTEVAKKLIMDTDGDPQAMIDLRRQQLTAIAQANPAQAPNLAGWLKRLDSLQAEAGNMQRVGAGVIGQPQYPTSGTPTARDVASLLPVLLAKGQKHADELYGPDQTNPDRFAYLARYEAQVKAQLGSKVAQLTAIQNDYLNDVSDYVQGLVPQGQGGIQQTGGRAGGPGMTRVTSIPQLQAMNPELYQKFLRLDAAGKQHIAVLMDQAQRDSEKGNPALWNEYRNRINLPADDPNKVNWIQQISQDPRVVAGALNQAQWSSLRTELSAAATDDGRSMAAVKHAGEALARTQFRSNMVLTNAGTDYGKAEYAQALWAQNADKVVGQYKAQNKDIRPLFYADTPESLISPRALAPFAAQAGAMANPAAMLNSMANQPNAAPLAPVQQPPTIDTREKLDAWFQTLPPGATTFTGTDGKVRKIPPRAASAPSTQPAKPEMNDSGQIVFPPNPVIPLPLGKKPGKDKVSMIELTPIIGSRG